MRPFIRSFLPSSILEDESVDSQRILSFVGMTLGYIVFLLPLLAFFLGVGQRRLSWALGVAILLLSLTLLLYRTTGLFVASVNGVLFLFWGLSLYSSFYLGGLHAPLLYGVLLLPVLGVFLLGRWGSVAWGVIAAMSFVVLAIYDAPASASLALPAAQMKGLQVGSMLGLVGFLSFLAWGFDSARENFKSEVHTSHQALRHSQEQMRSVMSYSPIMLWSLAADGTILLAEGSKRVHFSPDDATLVGAHYGELYKDSMLCELMETALSGDDCSASIERGDQTFEAHFSPVYEGEKLVGAVGIATDITSNQRFERIQKLNDELRVARDEALEANKIKSLFLANMSHELRTPLNAIIGYSEMISEDFEDLEPEDLKEDVERVYKAGKHLLSLLNDILDLSKIEAGKMDLYMEPVKVQELIDDVSSTSESLATANQNELKVIVKDIPEYVLADQTKLRQTLFNLLSNACKFTEKGSVTLTVDMETDESENDWLTFEVEDTGIGITPEQMKNLFQNFSQGDSSTTKKFGGTGLGLALSRRFCEMMGGTLTVSSVPDEGSTFTAKLPHRTTAMLDHKSQSSDQLTTKPSTGNGQTILVIDDEPDALDLLTRFLTKQGFNVVTSSTGKEGLKIAKQIHPMVIILDVIMPGINGWQLLTSIKSDDEICDIPVVMLSILDEGKKGFALGASEYMTKPVNPTRLIEVIHRFKKDTPLSVMVVEDDPATRDILQRTLHKNDCTVYEAENGAIALDLLETKTPSLILLDLMMPEVDGFTFLHELRQKEAHAHTPVIVLTAKELTNEEKDLLNGASQRILAKGATELDTLFNEIHHQVNQHIQ